MSMASYYGIRHKSLIKLELRRIYLRETFSGIFQTICTQLAYKLYSLAAPTTLYLW